MPSKFSSFVTWNTRPRRSGSITCSISEWSHSIFFGVMSKVGPKPYRKVRRKIRKRHAIVEMAELFGFPVKQTGKNSHLK